MTADADLVRLSLRGDPAAMRALVERYQGDVFGLCFRLLRHAQDAEDVAQEVFLRVFRSLAKWDAARPLRPWILGIAVNRCRTALGKRSRRPETVDYLHETEAAKPLDDSQETAAAIRAAVDALRAEYREVFVLFHEQGQAYDAISDAIGRPIGTVKTWLHRARAEVLGQLRKRGLMPDGEQAKVKEP